VEVTRTNDLDHMHRAYTAGVVARLRAGRTNEAIAWANSLLDRPSWYELVDRPLVWDVPQTAGSLQGCLDRLRWRQVSLEACRLTLALRLYRETYGTWPQTLAQLAPEILPKVPADPFSGKPFLYRVGTHEYMLASVGMGDHPEGWLLSTNRLAESPIGYRKQVFGSGEPEAALAWKREQLARRPMMDVQMLMRYGLLPKGLKIVGTNLIVPGVSSGTSSSPPASTNRPMTDVRMLKRYGLLPQGMRIVASDAVASSHATVPAKGTNAPGE
jgi:hypothetical protein